MKLILLLLSTFLITLQLHYPTNVDTIYTHGYILTMENSIPQYIDCVAVTNAKIVYAGSTKYFYQMQGPNTKVVDLKGKTMLPGFIDSHSHITVATLLSPMANLNPSPDGNTNNFADIVTNMNAWAANSTNQPFITAVGWLCGFGYDDSSLA
jgi:predicted amidohydrolase YtcJ